MILWTNAKFYSMKENNHYYNHILTNKGVIVALDDEALKYEPFKVIDLKGSFVFPGFTDSHLHLIGYGRKLNSLNLNRLKSKNKVIKKINAFYQNKDLRIEGYFDVGLTKRELDLISKNYYIILRHSDYHSFTVNSKVLKELNISSELGIITDESEVIKILRLWEISTNQKLTKYTVDAIEKLHSLGITNVHTDDLSYFNSYEETIEILKEVSNRKHLRINTLIHYSVLNNFLKYYPKSKYLNPIQVKVFYDGTLASKTAYLNDNYKGLNHNGAKEISEEEFENIIKNVRNINKGLAIHTIGDKALDEVISILNKYPTENKDRIVHGSLALETTIRKVTDQVIDIQPLFIKSDQKLIKSRIAHSTLVYPFKTYLKNNIILNGSSDAPVEDPNPIKSLKILLKLGFSNYEAIKTYTVNPSLTICDQSGLIEVGKTADFTVFDRDLLKIKRRKIEKAVVLYTVVNENIVYSYK